jgi:hypothetical protein
MILWMTIRVLFGFDLSILGCFCLVLMSRMNLLISFICSSRARILEMPHKLKFINTW